MLITIARSAYAEDVSELVADLRSSANLPDADYLEAELDKEALMALGQQLSVGGDKKVE